MWTMDELVERVREALAAEYSGADDGRVRDVPDRRAIRWYTTIGLVDRPLGMRGRSALYGPRHLQQLVAIKRQQAEGRSLSQIQADFVWLSDDGLAELSRVPGELLETDGSEPDDAANGHHMRFWARQSAAPASATQQHLPRTSPSTIPAGGLPTPAPPTAGPPTAGPATAEPATAEPPIAGPATAGPPTAGPPTAGPPGPPNTGLPASGPPPNTGPSSSGLPRTPAPGAADEPVHTRPVHGVMLRGGAILLVPHPLSERDRADLAAAAAPLLDLLEDRGLLDGRSE